MSVYAKDKAPWLKEAIESVLSNTIPPTEFILVADGPLTPELEGVIDGFKEKLKLVRLEKNMGLGNALNVGLKECSCPLVARMDSDDIAEKNRFELQLAAFKADKDLAVLGGAIEEIDSATKKSLSLRRLPLTDSEIKVFLKKRSPFNHVTVMFQKEAVLAAGGYQHLHLVEDYYLWARMAKAGYTFANLPQTLMRVRIDSDMFARRGGYKYFKSNKAISTKLLKLGLISWPEHIFNLSVRFCVQVLMPNSVRALFYKKVLR